jgi:hypothetical protein
MGTGLRINLNIMKNSYKSNYTDKMVSAAQYIAERICEHLAKKDRTELCYQFWSTTKYKKVFLYQVQLANGLLKLYKAEAIIAALRKHPNIYSLGATFLDQYIKLEEEDLTRREMKISETKQEEIIPDITAKPRPVFTDKKSTISKLRDL